MYSMSVCHFFFTTQKSLESESFLPLAIINRQGAHRCVTLSGQQPAIKNLSQSRCISFSGQNDVNFGHLVNTSCFCVKTLKKEKVI